MSSATTNAFQFIGNDNEEVGMSIEKWSLHKKTKVNLQFDFKPLRSGFQTLNSSNLLNGFLLDFQ